MRRPLLAPIDSVRMYLREMGSVGAVMTGREPDRLAPNLSFRYAHPPDYTRNNRSELARGEDLEEQARCDVNTTGRSLAPPQCQAQADVARSYNVSQAERYQGLWPPFRGHKRRASYNHNPT